MEALAQKLPLSRNKAFALVLVLFALARNLSVERAIRSKPLKMNTFWTSVHAIIFITRLIPTLTARRLLGIKTVTSNWWAHEEAAMRIAHFVAKLGDVYVPNVFINGLTNLQSMVARPMHGLFVTEIPPERLGFGENSSGRKKFGKSVECSGKWLTLDEKLSYETPGVVKILYIHGGGFVIGQAGMYLSAHGQLLKLLRERGLTAGILDVEYPLAPQVKHPVPIETCLHVYDYLVHEKGIILPEDLIVGGDSAGGNIALNVGLRATRWGCAGVLLFSPWVGHSHDTESHEEFADIDFIGGKLLLEQYQEAHVQGGREQSIVDQSLHVFKKELPFCALPPVWIAVGGFEVFKDDVLRLARELELHEANITLHYGPEVPHIFPMLWPLFIDKSGPALEECADFCVERLLAAREQARVMARNFTESDLTKMKRVLSSTDVSTDLMKSFAESDANKLKLVLSSSNFADLINA